MNSFLIQWCVSFSFLRTASAFDCTKFKYITQCKNRIIFFLVSLGAGLVWGQWVIVKMIDVLKHSSLTECIRFRYMNKGLSHHYDEKWISIIEIQQGQKGNHLITLLAKGRNTTQKHLLIHYNLEYIKPH